VTWIKNHFPDQRVIYVCGNHEYYGARPLSPSGREDPRRI
jgi:hypothetical protein